MDVKLRNLLQILENVKDLLRKNVLNTNCFRIIYFNFVVIHYKYFRAEKNILLYYLVYTIYETCI